MGSRAYALHASAALGMISYGPVGTTWWSVDTAFVYARPLLVVEVLSRTTRHRDEQQKRAFYQRIGVPGYWMVDRWSSRRTDRSEKRSQAWYGPCSYFGLSRRSDPFVGKCSFVAAGALQPVALSHHSLHPHRP